MARSNNNDDILWNDLPLPISGTDLPTPVHRSHAMSFKAPIVNLPPAWKSGRSHPSMISLGDLDLDLPTPVNHDNLLTPNARLDLLAPIDVDSMTPANAGMLTPISFDVEPAHILPKPVDQDLSPADLGVTPVSRDVGSTVIPSAALMTAFGLDPALARRSPTPRDVGVNVTQRPLILVTCGVALLAILSGGAWALGAFDPPEDIIVTRTVSPHTNDNKSDTKVLMPVPLIPAVEFKADVHAPMVAVVESISDDVDMLLLRARLHLAQGKIEDAKEALEHVLTVAPNEWEARMLLAQAMLEAGEYSEALVQITRSMPLTPSAERYLLCGKILEYNARHADAKLEYLKALQIDPDLVEARFLYGRLEALMGDSRIAVDHLTKVVAVTDQFPEAYLNLGRAQRDIGDHAAAIANFDKAIALDDKLLEAHYLRGRTLFETNAMAKAADALAAATVEAASKERWYADALVFLGRALVKQGKSSEARVVFKKFLEVAPTNHVSRADAKQRIAALR